ncbi:hypothetical protein MAC_03207 [Metarhizium acridum CQMa 102]|uniref:Uncharacterized protein n=1 Tax=Metarhizium acridum (strain CQMa 102) TaxID=655827 RepID=E9E009_METAQ|nr:uncharacterized protein MAC_03207 [Metarhizium acridum CQMa 102]EFY90844.1 hypothetical protein MAC_03207 [Metarhizium acridum CQMa 102]
MASPQPALGSTSTQPSPLTSTTSTLLSVTRTSPTSTTATLPALTTPWGSPQSCTWTYVVSHPEETASPGAVAFLDLEPMPGASTLSCYPNGMFSYGRTGIFSPVSLDQMIAVVDFHADLRLAVPITYDTIAGTYDVLTQYTTTLYSAMLAVSTIQVQFTAEDKKELGIGSDQDDVSRTLSMGARIGIAVGACAFVLLCLCLIYYLLAMRRRSREGLTKDRLMRDLKTMHRRGPSHVDGPYAGDLSMSSTISSTQTAYERREPPPAYDPGRARRIPESRDADSGRQRDGQIRALNEQKAVIEQRIEELQMQETARHEPLAPRN